MNPLRGMAASHKGMTSPSNAWANQGLSHINP